MSDSVAQELANIAALLRGTSDVYDKLPNARPKSVSRIFAGLADRVEALVKQHARETA
ncbi:hypothetical protein [Mesorhizobium sp.]|uniref:hypothetical protein n=1 Tax=Mesorhizobium sp. TaxID=1871066 RepID=UPI0025BC2668|nr:hypothetical protein [Mesorhizobium sp.]